MRFGMTSVLGTAAVAFAMSSAATAALIDVTYQIRRPGSAGVFAPMRYFDEEDNMIPLAGGEIISTRIHVDYVPDSPEDLEGFEYTLDVPVADPVLAVILISPDLLTPIAGTDAYGYDLVTSDHNGTILDTTFGYQFLGGYGEYTPDSAITFTVKTVETPEPMLLTAAVALPIAFGTRRRR